MSKQITVARFISLNYDFVIGLIRSKNPNKPDNLTVEDVETWVYNDEDLRRHAIKCGTVFD